MPREDQEGLDTFANAIQSAGRPISIDQIFNHLSFFQKSLLRYRKIMISLEILNSNI